MFHFLGRKNNHLGKKHQTELTDDGRRTRVQAEQSRRRARAAARERRPRPPSHRLYSYIIDRRHARHLPLGGVGAAARRRAVGRLPKNERASEPTAAEGEAD